MKKILVFAAHPDDEALGCMGTLLYFKSKGYKIKICFMSDGESSRKLSPNKKEKLIKSRMEQAKLVSKKSKLIRPNFFNFPDNMLDTIPLLLIVKKVEKEIKEFKPSIIFTHFEDDLNIDHQITCKSVLTATRPKTNLFVKKLYCFETLSNTDFSFKKKNKVFNPNFFVDIDKFIKKKLELLKIYKKEIRKWPHQRSIKGVKILSNYRGSQIGIKNAEAFMCLRELL
jgi:LmbE family N-acetylglucosaminyl deacetylase|tara:strand:- start:765 stop:1445 length:681 start_codon:yes stop_codon:yes gene_type:complete